MKQAGKLTSADSGSVAGGKQEMSSARCRSVKESTSTLDLQAIRYPSQAPAEDPLLWFPRAVGKLRALWRALTYPFALFGKGAWVHYSCHISRSAAPYIAIGENVNLAPDVRLDVSPVPGADPPVLILEAGSGMQRRCMVSARNRIHLMKNVMFGFSVLVMDHGLDDDESTDTAGRSHETRGGTIRIEEDCWIGCGAVITCEQGQLVIGRHSVVGANSLITRSIPPYSVVAGNPAMIVRQYDFLKEKWVLGCIRPMAATDPRQPDPPAKASADVCACESDVPGSAGEVSRGVR